MLNFDVTKKCLVAEGWCPIFAKAQVIFCLQVSLDHAEFVTNFQLIRYVAALHNVCINLSFSFFAVFLPTDSRSITTCYYWQQFTSGDNISCHECNRITTNIFQNKPIHIRISRNSGRIRVCLGSHNTFMFGSLLFFYGGLNAWLSCLY